MTALHTLSTRTLNRTYLARQWLLTRQGALPLQAIAHLVGMQAQVNNPPYIGLWTRLAHFAKHDLAQAIHQRDVVRAAMMRATLHLVTREDFLALRPAMQPVLERGLSAFFGKRLVGVDREALVAHAHAALRERPLTQAEQRTLLREHEPNRDGNALAYMVRTALPLVQVPPGGVWGVGGSPPYALAEPWLGAPIAPTSDVPALVRRYLAAFGPASWKDTQVWLGSTGLKVVYKAMRPTLRVYHDEQGRELFDLLDAPIIHEDAPAPVRYIPEYDNILIGHDDRRRIIAPDHRKRVFLSAARVLPTVLVDGFVAGTWKADVRRGQATLTVSLFASIPADALAALHTEGAALLHFISDGVERCDVHVVVDG